MELENTLTGVVRRRSVCRPYGTLKFIDQLTGTKVPAYYLGPLWGLRSITLTKPLKYAILVSVIVR